MNPTCISFILNFKRVNFTSGAVSSSNGDAFEWNEFSTCDPFSCCAYEPFMFFVFGQSNIEDRSRELSRVRSLVGNACTPRRVSNRVTWRELFLVDHLARKQRTFTNAGKHHFHSSHPKRTWLS